MLSCLFLPGDRTWTPELVTGSGPFSARARTCCRLSGMRARDGQRREGPLASRRSGAWLFSDRRCSGVGTMSLAWRRLVSGPVKHDYTAAWPVSQWQQVDVNWSRSSLSSHLRISSSSCSSSPSSSPAAVPPTPPAASSLHTLSSVPLAFRSRSTFHACLAR